MSKQPIDDVQLTITVTGLSAGALVQLGLDSSRGSWSLGQGSSGISLSSATGGSLEVLDFRVTRRQISVQAGNAAVNPSVIAFAIPTGTVLEGNCSIPTGVTVSINGPSGVSNIASGSTDWIYTLD